MKSKISRDRNGVVFFPGGFMSKEYYLSLRKDGLVLIDYEELPVVTSEYEDEDTVPESVDVPGV